ncbi:MAG: hypothetical protein K0R25_1334 [Rickettsiaceae bacterium]|jgi:uncharacterized protein YggE|nr:hypothetical protein [Rickettsiaceae bacterium]
MNIEKTKNLMYLAITCCALSIAVLVIILGFNQRKQSDQKIASINIDGAGHVMAKPDIAIIKMSMTYQALTNAEAAKMVRERVSNITQTLTQKFGVDEKDIKTENYYTYPKYEYPKTDCVNNNCPPQNSVVVGMVANQQMTIKVRKIDVLDNIISSLNSSNESRVDGFSFLIEDDEKFKEQAREIAIKEAKDKAKKLAEQLGVKLVRITSFKESRNQPNYLADSMMNAKMMMSSAPDQPAMTPGESKITSNVSLTYEIE